MGCLSRRTQTPGKAEVENQNMLQRWYEYQPRKGRAALIPTRKVRKLCETALLLLVIVTTLAAAGCAPGSTASSATPSAASSGAGGTTVTVSRVVDGDTVDVSPEIEGEHSIRIIGADTPEDVRPGYPTQPLSLKAAAFTRSRLEGKRVRLTFDTTHKDKYDRLLAYLWVGKHTMIEDELLKKGLAQLLIIPPNDRYASRFRADQEQARRAHRGLWGLPKSEQCKETNRGNGIGVGSPGCSSTSTGGSYHYSRSSKASSQKTSGGVAPVSEESCPRSHPIKGNISEDGEKIYHLPHGDPYYSATHPERCFASPAQARAAGYRAPRY